MARIEDVVAKFDQNTGYKTPRGSEADIGSPAAKVPKVRHDVKTPSKSSAPEPEPVIAEAGAEPPARRGKGRGRGRGRNPPQPEEPKGSRKRGRADN